MSRVLFMAQRMVMGYGVDRLIHELAVRLAGRGHEVLVLCNESDGTYRGSYRVTRLDRGTVEEVVPVAAAFGPDVAIACTTPFFEMLPVLRQHHRTWAWECGDPTPAFFPGEDGERREVIKRTKIDSVYPVIDGVVAISDFIRSDIEWPAARVVHCGCDHAPDLGSKGLQDVRMASAPLRVGTLMRFGKGEARYKGNGLFRDLARAAQAAGDPIEFQVMGRGSEEDARELREAGCTVLLNANDEEKWRYLRSLDAFVSCSLWEGFNLPLAEAQAVGSLGIAFDAGAHPEVSPLVFSSLPETLEFLRALAADRGLVLRHSRAAYHYVRRQFSWDRAAADLERHVLAAKSAPPSAESSSGGYRPLDGPPVTRTYTNPLASALRSLRYEGWRATVRKLRQRLRGAID